MYTYKIDSPVFGDNPQLSLHNPHLPWPLTCFPESSTLVEHQVAGSWGALPCVVQELNVRPSNWKGNWQTELESGPLSVIHGNRFPKPIINTFKILGTNWIWYFVHLTKPCRKVPNMNLPWHSPKLQSLVSGCLLPHMPPDPIWLLAAIGFLVCVPGPHVLEHDDHWDHLQLSENEVFYTFHFGYFHKNIWHSSPSRPPE